MCQQSIRDTTTSATHPTPTPEKPAGAARCQHPLVRHLSQKHTTPHTTTFTHRPNAPACTPTHGPTHTKVNNHAYLPSSITVVMLVLEPNAALKAFKPASVTSARSVWVCASNQYEPQRGAPPTHLPRPSNLLVRPGANIHSPCTFHTSTPHQTRPHHTPSHSPTDRTSNRMHKKARLVKHTSHLCLLLSVTAVMVVLEPNAALKAFKPASLTLESPVCVC